MKNLISRVLVLSLMAAAPAHADGVRVFGGIAKTRVAGSSEGHGVSAAGDDYFTNGLLGVDYLKGVESLGIGLEGALVVSSPSLVAAQLSGPLRLEANVTRDIIPGLRAKVGPAVAHLMGDTGSLERTGFGFQAAGEADIAENVFGSLGYYATYYKGQIQGFDVKDQIAEFQLRVGYSF
jgi:hypothetical protein